MRKLISLVMMLALGSGGWFASQKLEFDGHGGISLRTTEAPETGGGAWGGLQKTPPPVQRSGDTVRVASFNIQVFGTSKAGKPQVMEVLANVVRRFDIVAIQEIRTQDPNLLAQFVAQINSAGRHYDYVIGPPQGRTSSTEQYAFVFDTASIEVDREAVYSINDPHSLLHRPPLVAPFRVRGPPPDQAFTFTLINIHTDPDETEQELNVLDDVFRVVRNDGRGEDDVILLGDLNVDDRKLGELGEVPGIMWLISGVPTNTRGTKLYDNLLFHRQATAEFAGRAGVFDIMREYNLTMDQALEVSDHLPIWGEFHLYEAGRGAPGSVATRPGAGMTN